MFLSDKFALSLQLDRKTSQKEQDLEFYHKGEEIPLINLGLWQVYRGVVQLNRLDREKKELVIGWVTPNHVFGQIIGSSLSYVAIAMSDTYLRYYKPEDMVNDPQLARQLISELSHRLVKSEQMVAIISLRKVEDRLRELFLMLKEEMGHLVEGGSRLTARFTHQNIADAICTTRVTVTKVLGDWQQQNLIEFDSDRHIIIKF